MAEAHITREIREEEILPTCGADQQPGDLCLPQYSYPPDWEYITGLIEVKPLSPGAAKALQKEEKFSTGVKPTTSTSLNWRFWAGLSLLGVGLFLIKKR